MSLGRFTSAYTMSFLHKSHSCVSKFEGQKLVVRLYITYFEGIVNCIITVTYLKRIKIYSFSILISNQEFRFSNHVTKFIINFRFKIRWYQRQKLVTKNI